jgi:hypothetical protein
LPEGVTVTAVSPTRAFAFADNTTCTDKTSCVTVKGLYETTDGGAAWSAVGF